VERSLTDARGQILSGIRAALADAPAAEPIPRAYRRETGASIETFVERLLDYKAEVHRELTDLEKLCRGRRVIVPPGLRAEWRPTDAVEDHDFSPRELDGFDSVVTGCIVAIAETGTLVLANDRRALTLVPDHHICIVLESQVVDSVPAAIDLLDPRSPLTLVSGPSATSDIELSRVEGVHGPRRLTVLLLADGRGDL
jgi:L-lactate dehydrogenase complex protein LldG